MPVGVRTRVGVPQAGFGGTTPPTRLWVLRQGVANPQGFLVAFGGGFWGVGADWGQMGGVGWLIGAG